MKKVVVLGGSFAGARAAKAVLRAKSGIPIELIMISPSKFSYNCVATPRILIEPEKMDKLFFNLADHLEGISGKNTFRFVKGYATEVDLPGQNVVYEELEGISGSIKYDALVIATGNSYSSFMKLEADQDHEYTKDGLRKLIKSFEKATTIAVIGGGSTGAEVIGELAEHYPSAKTTLITGSSGPLSMISDGVARTAEKKLLDLGVEVVNNKRVASFTDNSILYEDGTKSTFDVVVPAFSHAANSQFLQKELLDSKGYVLTDDHLNIPNHPEVLVYGDIVSGGSKTIIELEHFTPAVLKSWVNTIVYNVKGSTLKTFKKSTSCPVWVVPISRKGGITYLWGFTLHWLTWLAKGRNYFIDATTELFS